MLLNGTLVAQIVNFFIAYYILSRILLRPCVDAVHKKNNAKKLIEHEISISDQLVKRAQEKKQDELSDLTKILTKNIPPLAVTNAKCTVHDIVLPEVQQIELQKKQAHEDLVNLICQKVEN